MYTIGERRIRLDITDHARQPAQAGVMHQYFAQEGRHHFHRRRQVELTFEPRMQSYGHPSCRVLPRCYARAGSTDRAIASDGGGVGPG
jgi:hypothetical protein